MAEFSKQYCDIYDPEFPWDFDFDELSKDLKPGWGNFGYICEGFGISAIARTESGHLIVSVDDMWVDYNAFLTNHKNNLPYANQETEEGLEEEI